MMPREDATSARLGPTRLELKIAIAVMVVVVVCQALAFHDVRHDDAYISFRYGQNLASGHGLVFNPGERLMGSTSPGHVLIAAAGYGGVGKAALPSLMSVLGCLGWSAQALGIVLLLWRPLGRAGAMFVGLGIAFGIAWSQRFVALETNLVAAMIIWAMVCGLARRWKGAAFACAIAGLLRPDAALAALLLGIQCIRDRGVQAWKPASIGIAVAAPWLLFAPLYFGSLIPRSAVVKVGSASLSDYASMALQYVSAQIIQPAIHLEIGTSLDLVGVGVWSIAITGAIVIVRREPRLWVLPVWGILHLIVYVGMHAEVGFEWHLYPTLLCISVLSLSCVAWLANFVSREPRGRVAVALLLAVALLGVLQRTFYSAEILGRAYWYGARDQVYRDIAELIHERAEPGDVIVAPEVGTLAYHTELPMIDLAGLVTRNPRRTLEQLESPPRFKVTVPAYGGRGPKERVARVSRSEPTLPGERQLAGQDRFIAVVFDMKGD